MSVGKNKLKTKVYKDSIGQFVHSEFDEDFDDEKKKFFEDASDLNFDRYLISAARDFGKTWLLAKVALWSTTVLPDYYGEPYNVSILGGSHEQSKKVYEEIKKSLDKSDYVENKVDRSIQSVTDFNDGSKIRALKASQSSVRGQHSQLLCLDECAEIDEDIITAATESVEAYKTRDHRFPARYVLSSTPHVYDSFFVEHLQNPEEWGFRTYKWRAIDSYNKTQNEVEDARRRLDERKFKREWLGKAVSQSATLLDHEDIKHSVIKQRPEIKNDGYITGGIDWGKDHPSTIVVVQKQGNYDYVLDARKWRQKKFEWIKGKIIDLYDRYNIDLLLADNSHEPVVERIRDEGAHIKAISFSAEKQNMISNMLFKFENGRVKIPSKFSDLIEELKIYHRKRREKDDLVDGLMLSLKGQKNRPRSTRTPTDEDVPISLGDKR